MKWTEEDEGICFRGKDGIEFTIECFDMKLQFCYYRRGIEQHAEFFDFMEDAKQYAEETYNDLLSKYKPHIATKEEIEENRRKAYKYLF
jgi:hypothetical protein